jgi:hypothetical protein
VVVAPLRPFTQVFDCLQQLLGVNRFHQMYPDTHLRAALLIGILRQNR